MWVIDHLDDLEADFRVFYRIDDFETLSGPQFFKLAYRVAAYSGVMAARVAAEMERERGSGNNYSSPQRSEQKVHIGNSQAELASIPGKWFSFTKAPRK